MARGEIAYLVGLTGTTSDRPRWPILILETGALPIELHS
jgi:hypothetical protein